MNELKRRVWNNGERSAWLADKIVTGSLEYCNEAAYLLRKYSQLEKEKADLQSRNLKLEQLVKTNGKES